MGHIITCFNEVVTINKQVNTVLNTDLSFNGQTVTLRQGQTKTLTDTTNTLSKYFFERSDINGVGVAKSGNTVTISASNNSRIGNTNFKLRREVFRGATLNGTTLFWVKKSSPTTYQAVATINGLDLRTNNINVKTEVGFGSLKIVKYESGTNKPLANAQFELFEKATNKKVGVSPYGTFNTDGYYYTVNKSSTRYHMFTNDKGEIDIKNIPLGSYYIKELKAPYGYVLREDKIDVNITETVLNQTRKLANRKIPTQVIVEKVDSETKDPLRSVQFEIHDANGKKLGIVGKGTAFDTDGHYYEYSVSSTKYNMFTNSKGLITVKNLPLGSYKLVEIQTLAEYNLLEDPISINLTATRPNTKRTVENDKAGGHLRLFKQTPDGRWLDGAVFELISVDSKEVVKFRKISPTRYTYDPEGDVTEIISVKESTILFTDLLLGTYKIRELRSPKGFLAPNMYLGGGLEVDMTEYANYYATIEPNKTIRRGYNNYEQLGHLEIIKVNEENETLEGVEFQIADKETGDIMTFAYSNGKYLYDSNSSLSEVKTNAEGKINIENLPLGANKDNPKTYEIKEISTIKGYLLLENTVDVTFTPDESGVHLAQNKTLENKSTKAQFIKYNVDREILAGAELQLLDGEIEVTRWTTTKEPFIIKELEIGKTYTLRELKAPEGYLVADDVDVTILETSEMQTFEMTDHRVPEIKTKFADINGGKEVLRLEDVTLVDNVEYKNLIVDKEYTLTLTVMSKETGKPLLDKEGNEVTTTHTFIAQSPEGVEQVTITVDLSNYEGTQIVAFEKLLYKGIEIATHEDIEDKDQTVDVPKPELKTKFADFEGNKEVYRLERTTLVDNVEYKNLIVGKEYTLTLTVMNKDTNKPLTTTYNGEEYPVTTTHTFTAQSSDGVEKVEIIVDLSSFEGSQIVAFERLSHNGIDIAIHEDINDKDQTIDFPNPEIKTKFADFEGNKEVHKLSEVKLVDNVEYKNLIVGKEYTLELTVMDKDTNKPLTTTYNGEEYPVTTTHTFTAQSSDGVEKVEIIVDLASFEGTQIVAFEKLLYQGIEIATHEDLEDKDQTISVPKPELKTKFADVNGSKTVKALGKVKFVDNVEYKNLIVGKEYTLTLTVMNKDTNKPITDAKGNVLTSTTTFTATKPDGVEKVEMTIDLTGYKTVELVAFEKLSHKGIDIALHEDINDKDQTVKIVEPAKPNNPKTNDTFKALGFVVAISVATLGLFVLTAKKKRLSK